MSKKLQENLMVINDNNQRRRSLVIDDEYDSSNSQDSSITPPIEKTKELVSNSIDNEPILNDINDDELHKKINEGKERKDEKFYIKSSEKNDHVILEIPKSISNEPTDIIPFVKAVKNHRYKKNGEFYSRFGDIKFKPLETIFDKASLQESEFYGFYNLFWLALAIFMLNTFINYYRENGALLNWPLARILRKDLIKVGLTDLLMYVAIYFVLLLQTLIKKNILSWDRSAWWIQTTYQFFFLMFFIWFAGEHCMSFPWIARVFLVLHSLVLLMKMHSYGFYNGYLWKIYNELYTSTGFLKKFEDQELEAKDEETIKTLKESIAFCKFELECQSSPSCQFPDNISFSNFFMYTMFPTVVYAIEYPRTEKIRWGYVLSKITGIFGLIFLMLMVAQNWMYPIAMRAISIRDQPFIEKCKEYPFLLLDMIPPFILQYLFQFYLIWDTILNTIAELTRFADREFYLNWWSCVDWSEFSRDWNRPVHKFLLRHVYHSSISAFNFTKLQATFVTFLLSSFIHELVMYVIFRRLRGYLLLLQMSQIPLVIISKSKFLKNRKKLGNLIFWFGIITGPSLMCTLYLTF